MKKVGRDEVLKIAHELQRDTVTKVALRHQIPRHYAAMVKETASIVSGKSCISLEDFKTMYNMFVRGKQIIDAADWYCTKRKSNLDYSSVCVKLSNAFMVIDVVAGRRLYLGQKSEGKQKSKRQRRRE